MKIVIFSVGETTDVLMTMPRNRSKVGGSGEAHGETEWSEVR